jgi:hypothetical protein
VLSQHPADRLIRELIATHRQATPEEVAVIVARMASAPFDGRIVKIPPALRPVIGGTTADSLAIHLAKRTFVEQQWVDGTTAVDYVADLRRAILAPTARYLAYTRRGGNLAASITPATDVLPSDRLGVRHVSNMLVVYSVDRGVLISGYQFSDLSKTGIPEEVTWIN